MALRALRVHLGVGLPVVAGYLAVPAGLARDVAYLGLGVGSVVAIVVGIRLHRPSRALPWWLMAAGQLTWVAGDVVYTGYERFGAGPPFPSLADVLYLAAYPLLAVGFGLLIRGRRAGDQRDGLIDSAIVTVALGLLSWVCLMRPAVMDHSATLLERTVGLAYPLGDILLLGVLVRLATSPGARAPAFLLLGTAGTLLLAADTAFAAISLTSSYEGGAVDLLWLGSYVAWGAAALHPSMRSLSLPPGDPVTPLTRRRLLALTSAILMAPATLATQLLLGVALDGWAVVLSSVALSLLVVARMSGLLRRVQHQAGLLAELAGTDALTGLPNRRSADAELLRLVARAGDDARPLVVAMLDVDRFKVFNDTLGHRAGDRLLADAAAAWRGVLGEDGMVARYGGEEFLVLLPGCSAARSVEVLDRLRVVMPEGQTVSVGAACWDGREDASHLVHRADVALYEAKRAGRDRVVLAASGGSPVTAAIGSAAA